METWMIFAIASMLFAGGNDFLMKIIASEGYNRDFIFMMRYFIGMIIAIGLYVSTVDTYSNLSVLIGGMVVLGILKALLTYAIGTLKVKSLENIDTTLFFPIYKTLSATLVLLISVFILNENLSTKESIAIILSLIMPFFLITKAEKGIQKNLKMGLIYTGIIGVVSCLSIWASKYANILELNIELFAAIVFMFGFFASSVKYTLNRNHPRYQNKSKVKMFFVSIAMGVFFFLAAYSLLKALSGNMAVVYTISSFSILVPIILSVIFYKEEMTYKKAFVIFLSIVSVILFI